MAYKINYTDIVSNPDGITVQDQSLNTTDTDLVFVGKNYPGYAQFVGESFLHLLENFSGNIAPSKPVTGQLWYDVGSPTNPVNPVQPQLKVYDGTRWVEAGSIKKSTVTPALENSSVGDLWVDSVKQQLYLFTGDEWILVGPQFDEVSTSGLKIESIEDSADPITPKIVATIFIENQRVAMFSIYEFIPRLTLLGFPIIRRGITMSNQNINNKFWGTSEKANALIVGNTTVPAANFLRNDTVSTTNYAFNIRSASGLKIGESLETEITSVISGLLITQNTQNAVIKLRTTEPGTGLINDVLTIADKKIGVNKLNPLEAVDVNGNILSNGIIKTSLTTDATNVSTGSIRTDGGASINKSLYVGNNSTVVGQLISGTDSISEVERTVLFPATDNLFNIGSPSNRFKRLYVNNIETVTVQATSFTGSFTGTLNGTATSLQSPRLFQLVGDVISVTPQSFNGTSNVTLTTEIGPGLISSKEETLECRGSDQFLIYRESPPSLKRVSKNTLFSLSGGLPIGSIVPYAGLTAPTGYLLCDGSEISQGTYAALYSVIGSTYNGSVPLRSSGNFRIPDLRGRFATGREYMNNGKKLIITSTATSATRSAVFLGQGSTTFVFNNTNYATGNPWSQTQFFQIGRELQGTGLGVIAYITAVNKGASTTTVTVEHISNIVFPAASGLTISALGEVDSISGNPTPVRNPAATTLGAVGGTTQQTLTVNQLPEHTHDLKDSIGNQYYAVRNSTTSPPEPAVTAIPLHFKYDSANGLTNSGGISSPGVFGQPIDVLNPYITINYIIFAGA